SVARDLSENVANVLVTPMTNYIELARRWTTGLREAYVGENSIEDSLIETAHDMQFLASTSS
ncbi:MAG: hypothetical protein ABSG09_06040, partial [Acidimicrobiales bacterium]